MSPGCDLAAAAEIVLSGFAADPSFASSPVVATWNAAPQAAAASSPQPAAISREVNVACVFIGVFVGVSSTRTTGRRTGWLL